MLSAAVRRLSPLQWAGGGLGGCAVLLALLGLLAPASAFFFPLLSLWASVGLFVLALCVLRVAGAELDFFHKAVVFGIWAVAVVYFYWTLSSRSFVYVWDYANYLLKQYDAEAAFARVQARALRTSSAPWPTTTPISSPSSPSSRSVSRATPATPIPSVRCSASCPPAGAAGGLVVKVGRS